MARPTTKQELLRAASIQYEKLKELIGTMTKEEQIETFIFDADSAGKEAHWKRDKNIRDIFIHLYEWHQLLLNWVTSNQEGDRVTFLPKPYTWKTYGDMNIEFWKKHQDKSYETATNMLQCSHKKILDLIETFSDEELFTKKYFPWTGTTNLGSYCISATSSHYDWAIKKIKKQKKALVQK